jgi:hypothetical protein
MPQMAHAVVVALVVAAPVASAQQPVAAPTGPYLSASLGYGLLGRSARALTTISDGRDFQGGDQNPGGVLSGVAFSVGGGAKLNSCLSVGAEFTRWEGRDDQVLMSVLLGPTFRFGRRRVFVAEVAGGVVSGPIERLVLSCCCGECWDFHGTQQSLGPGILFGLGYAWALGSNAALNVRAQWTVAKLSDPDRRVVHNNYRAIRAGFVLFPDRASTRTAPPNQPLQLAGARQAGTTSIYAPAHSPDPRHQPARP